MDDRGDKGKRIQAKKDRAICKRSSLSECLIEGALIEAERGGLGGKSRIRQAYTHRRGDSDLGQGGGGESGQSDDGSSELHCGDDEVSLGVME